MNNQELKENLEEQIKDAINILQLLIVELSANEDDEHTIRAVSITIEKVDEIIAELQYNGYVNKYKKLHRKKQII